jgi:N-acetylmuramoyl-L-alanine amidase
MPMRPEPVALPTPDLRPEVDRLARALLALAGNQSVRVIEALAATLVNRAQVSPRSSDYGLAEPPVDFAGAPVANGADAVLQLCRRVARRAVRGSLADPTQGATAFHRIETTPPWSRDLLPIATFGPFLFYKTDDGEAEVEHGARDKPNDWCS